MIDVRTEVNGRIIQGDVLRNVDYIERVSESDGILEVSKISFPYIIVLTQDCDLAQDFTFRVESKQTQDKWLISVLVAPLYNATHVFSGKQLTDIGIKSQPIRKDKTDGKLLLQNQKPRYHYLEFPDNIPIVPSVIDFKHYFSVPVTYLLGHKKENFICTVSELFREDISHRFASFLSRIGLPGIQDAYSLETQRGA